MNERDIARFESKVDSSAGPDACHPWTAGVCKDGYGKFGVGGRARNGGKTLKAHRVAFFLAHGRWPLNALHTCDNPPCCNGAHVFEGTHADNMRDMTAKGRQARGERAPRVYLNTETVLRIRASTLGPQNAAREFRTSAANVTAIRRRMTWKHL